MNLGIREESHIIKHSYTNLCSLRFFKLIVYSLRLFQLIEK